MRHINSEPRSTMKAWIASKYGYFADDSIAMQTSSLMQATLLMSHHRMLPIVIVSSKCACIGAGR
jgi:hypothetical protein